MAASVASVTTATANSTSRIVVTHVFTAFFFTLQHIQRFAKVNLASSRESHTLPFLQKHPLEHENCFSTS
jgi:hypothetical protein